MIQDYYQKASKEEQEFLDCYDASAYPKPSVTADVVIFTVDPQGCLSVVLIKRGGWPYKGFWALPGGFLQADVESVGETAKRELQEETGLSGVFLQQLKTYSKPDRDPRMHVVSVAHYALIPYQKLEIIAGDDAADADIFRILNYNFVGKEYPYQFYSPKTGITFDADQLAFDHATIIQDAINRIYGRADYCLDLFALLDDPNMFTIGEFKTLYDAVAFRKTDNANFRKMFINRYVNTGKVLDLGRKSNSTRPAQLYSLIKEV